VIFFLFPKIKDLMRGERYQDADEALASFEAHLSGFQASDWNSCFEAWFRRMEKCIHSHGEYFEKK
jgi:hypothetical protein